MKRYTFSGLMVVICMALFNSSADAKKKASYYQITVYHFKTAKQELVIDGYLKDALLPALHKKRVEQHWCI